MRRCRESEVEIGKRLSQRFEEIDREMTVGRDAANAPVRGRLNAQVVANAAASSARNVMILLPRRVIEFVHECSLWTRINAWMMS